ncbi:MAG: hypothetical protein ACRCYZ_03175 [Alphaproteobacteria bacterium]
MMKHRYGPNGHGQITDTAVTKKSEKLLTRMESLEERFRLLELQVYPHVAEKQETPPPTSKPDQDLKSPSTPSTLRRWFSLRRKGQEENPQKKSSSTTPTSPILPVISAPLPLSPSLPRAKPVVVVIPLPPRLPAATPSVMAPPPPPPLQDNLLLSHVAEQPSGQKSFMEELQHKNLKPFEEKKNCSSPKTDIRAKLMQEMLNTRLKPAGERGVTQVFVMPQLSELDKMLAKKRQAIDRETLN